ncbi:hypothetical protein ACJJIG_04390 [Microbulbifer sp. SSSA007]|uniref:hypothetical protein n=1 Tax=Microbulbifer sp. SSSA007 TaxID=3243379 RepID=UPI004039C8EB
MKRALLGILICVCPVLSFSGPFAYECNIKNEFQLNSDGQLVTEYKIYSGKFFNVDRKTGVVLGGGVGNSSYKIKQIIDPGGKEQSFKLLWISHQITGVEGGHNSAYLTIKEYNENFLKPFILVLPNSMLTGTCK